MDGECYDEALLFDIESLLVLQLLTSGVTQDIIAKTLGMELKDFRKMFPWYRGVK